MNIQIGIALMTTALLAQMQLQVCAQSKDQLQSQTPQLEPASSATFDASLRGPIGGQTTSQSQSPPPFTTSSPYSYTEPANTANSNFDAHSYESQPAMTEPSPATRTTKVPSTPSKNAKQKRHGFSPAGAVIGVPDRAVKTSLGLTDRTAKAGLGMTGKTTKEFFKAIF